MTGDKFKFVPDNELVIILLMGEKEEIPPVGTNDSSRCVTKEEGMALNLSQRD